MPFVSTPNAGQSLGQTRDQMRENTDLLRTTLAVDHVDINSGTPVPGYHKDIHMIEVNHPGAIANIGQLHAHLQDADTQLFYTTATGVLNQLSGGTPTTPGYLYIGPIVINWGRDTSNNNVLGKTVNTIKNSSSNLYSVQTTVVENSNSGRYSKVRNVTGSAFAYYVFDDNGNQVSGVDIFWVTIGNR